MRDDQPVLIIHGHFYQPPRENPWTERIDKEPSAAPFHDWNERVHGECYRANAFARVIDRFDRISTIVNNFSLISFNVGPTLLSWLAANKKRTYQRILEADRESARMHGGHGNAIAQAYNHPILPLCRERDARTQIRWGLSEFQFRFGRPSEGIWLPETACNDNVLGYLIDEGVQFTILAPNQAGRVRRLGGEEWRDVSEGGIDTAKAYRYFHRDGSGRSIALFFFDSALARSIAFEGALVSSQGLIDRFEREIHGSRRLVHAATDGESYGHHARFGDRCLAFALTSEAPRRGFEVSNYGEYLETFPPVDEVELQEGPDGKGTSWSCSHGVGRWERHCGCQTGGREGWNQDWRGPLRNALSFLRDHAAAAFEEAGAELLENPWAARDGYIDRVLASGKSPGPFLSRHARKKLNDRQQVRALSLLEMQRFSLLMFTSCGWFFNELSGIETLQVLKYAGRLMDEMKDLGMTPPENEFLDRLSEAHSNLPERGDGAAVYRNLVLPARTTPNDLASSISLQRLVQAGADEGETAGFSFRISDITERQAGRFQIATGRVVFRSLMTCRQFDFAAAAIFLGGADFYCYLRPFPGEKEFERAVQKLDAQWDSASMPSLFGFLHEEFGPDAYGLEHIPSETRTVLFDHVFSDLMDALARQYVRIYEDNRRVIEMLRRGGFEMPSLLRVAAEFALGWRFEKAVLEQEGSIEPGSYRQALVILDEARRAGFEISRDKVRTRFERMIVDAVEEVVQNPTPETVERARHTVEIASALGVPVDVNRAQETLYRLLLMGEVTEGVKTLANVLGLASD